MHRTRVSFDPRRSTLGELSLTVPGILQSISSSSIGTSPATRSVGNNAGLPVPRDTIPIAPYMLHVVGLGARSNSIFGRIQFRNAR